MSEVGAIPKCKFCTDPNFKPADLIVHYSGQAICSSCLQDLAIDFGHSNPEWLEEIVSKVRDWRQNTDE